MKILFQNTTVRLLALSFCTFFLLQISLDVASKLSEKNKKELTLQQEENQDDGSSNDDQEKENEKETEGESDEDESKVLNKLLLLSALAEQNFTTLQKHLKHHNLPSGFYKTFTPPPERTIPHIS